MTSFGLLSIIFLPLWAVFFNLAGWRDFSREFSGILSTATSIFCAIICWIIFFEAKTSAKIILGEWLSFKNYSAFLELHLNPAVIYLLAVAGTVLALIHLLALQQLRRRASYKRLFIFLDLFSLACFLLITTGDFFLLLAIWMGLSLFALFSENYRKSEKNGKWQSKIPFKLNLTADILLLIAVVIIFSTGGQSQIYLSQGVTFELTGLFLLFSVLLKSGQFPFQYWTKKLISLPLVILTTICVLQLPLVVVVFYRFSFLWEKAPPLKYIFQSAGLISVILTGFLAANSKNYLKIIIYSTVNQAGWLLIGLTAGWAGYFHSVTIATANLLLIGGLLATGIRDIKKTDVLKDSPVYFLSLPGIFIMLGGLGISGLPAGGVFQFTWARSRIMFSLLNQSPLFFPFLLLGIFLTVFYIFKIIFNFITTVYNRETTTSRVTRPVFFSLVGAAAILFLNAASYYFLPAGPENNLFFPKYIYQLIESLVILAGISSAYVIYSPDFSETKPDLYPFKKSKIFTGSLFRLDKFINTYLVNPIQKTCYLLEELVDKLLFSGIPALMAATLETIAVCFNLVEVNCKREYDLKKIIVLMILLFVLTVWLTGA